MNNLKQIKNNNLKYYISEAVGIMLGLASSSLSAYATDKITDSNAMISVVSTISGTFVATVGNIVTYAGLHINDYKNRQRSLQQDVSSFVKSRLEGIAVACIIRLPLQYSLQEFCKVNPLIAAPVSQIVSGACGVGVRFFRNYQRNIFGNKPEKETKPDCEVLEDLVE